MIAGVSVSVVKLSRFVCECAISCCLVGERSFGRAVEDPVLAPVVMEHQNEMMEFHNEKKK